MSYYRGPFAILAIVLCLAGFLLKNFADDYSAATANRDSVTKAMQISQHDVSRRNASLQQIKSSASPGEKFLAQWDLYFQALNDLPDLQEHLCDLGRTEDLIVSRDFLKNDVEANVPVSIIPVTVKGEYLKTLKWLGEVEEQYPTTHLRQITITAIGPHSVTMNLQVAVTPFAELQPNPQAPQPGPGRSAANC